MLSTQDLVGVGVRCAVYNNTSLRREAVVFVHENPGPMDDWVRELPSGQPCTSSTFCCR